MFYYKLTDFDYTPIKQELERCSSYYLESGKRYYDPSASWIQEHCPLLTEFLTLKIKKLVRFYRFYFTQPFKNMIPHIDGFFWNPSPIGLNFPISNIDNTLMRWFETSEDNLIAGLYGIGDKHRPTTNTGTRVLDESLLNQVESTQIDSPTFVRTDVVHDVINPNPTVRAVLSVRFFIYNNKGRQFEDLLDEVYKF